MARKTLNACMGGPAKRAFALVAAISLMCSIGFQAHGDNYDYGVPIDYLVIKPDKPHMNVGDKLEFSVDIYPANATDKAVDWMISNSNAAYIFSIDEAAGTCTVEADHDGSAFLMAIARSNGVVAGVNIEVGAGGTDGNLPLDDITNPTEPPQSEPTPPPTTLPADEPTPPPTPPDGATTTPAPTPTPAGPTDPEWLNPFTDVRERQWFYADVKYAHLNGLFAGTTDTTFSPNEEMTRGMIVTVLGRLRNTDVSGYTDSSFTDVRATRYYAKYIEWARALGIVSGTGENLFEPETPITREQIAAMLDNYSRAMGLLLPDEVLRTEFEDNSRIARYARPAVDTMVRAGVINGREGNVFDPKAPCTRAEVAALVHRYALAARI